MISHLQKFVPAALVAIAVITPGVVLADDSKLIEWKAGSDPTGKIVDQDLFIKPEIRGKAQVEEGSGVMRFNGGSIVMGISDGEKFRHLMTQNDELTIEIDVIPFKHHQTGPARIISYSTDHSTRNITVGQEGDQFDLRLRTGGGIGNGMLPDSRFGKIVAGEKYHLAISYKSGHLAIAVNGKMLVERTDIEGPFDSWTEQQLVFGDELNGERAWHGEIHGLSLFNRAKNLRETAPNKEVAGLKKEIAQLSAEKAQLELRIKAGDQAGEDLEDQLADCIKRHNAATDLEKELIQARSLARREHERAEKISAEILEQVETQKAIAKELKQTIALVQRERASLLAKLKQQPKIDPEEKKRLIAENEKLSQKLYDVLLQANEQRAKLQASIELAAQQKSKLAAAFNEKTLMKKRLEGMEAMLEEIRQEEEELRTANRQLAAIIQTNEKFAAARIELAKKLKQVEAQSATMSAELKDLASAKKAAEKKATEHRAEALREKVERKKIELELQNLRAAQAAKKAAAGKAAAAVEAKLLDIAPIYFGKNQADSKAQEESLIGQVKKIHAAWPTATFAISGHTCTDGNPAGNLALSQRRAQRVADLIEKSGIPKSAISEVLGKGQTEPRADNSTQQGREANRRVEVKVLRK